MTEPLGIPYPVRAVNRLTIPDAIIVAKGLEKRCEAIIGNDYGVASRPLGIPYLYLEVYIS